jgi:hypothetical protein
MVRRREAFPSNQSKDEKIIMSNYIITRWRAALDLATMDDAECETVASAIQTVSATSPLAKNTSVATSLAAVIAKSATLATAAANIAAIEKQIKAGIALRDTARSAFDLEISTLKTLVENYATSAADISGMGFTLLDIVRAPKTVPDAPASLIVKIGAAHGKARIAVQGKGRLGSFAAQATFDPITPTSVWFTLPGSGKQRSLAYATGTKVWVQFAQVRYGLQGPWCTPVLVTMP